MRRRGRPAAWGARDLGRARSWRAGGVTDAAIGKRLDLDPDAQLARPHLGRRGLQMVLRLLAFNAQAWLAEHFNAYLADPNQYRAILRDLLHLGGHVAYTSNAITITLDRPERPRVARALQVLTEELNAITAVMPTDPRPLTYQPAQA
jgi:hypothetical protein